MTKKEKTYKVHGWGNDFTVKDLIRHMERDTEEIHFLHELTGSLRIENDKIEMENGILRKLLKEGI